jgi:hypothetical protein
MASGEAKCGIGNFKSSNWGAISEEADGFATNGKIYPLHPLRKIPFSTSPASQGASLLSFNSRVRPS